MVSWVLGVEQLTNLQTLALKGGSWLEGDGLGKLTQLRGLALCECSTSYLKTEFFKSIAKLTVLEILDFSFTEGHTKKTLVNRLGSVREKKNVTIDHHNKTLYFLDSCLSRIMPTCMNCSWKGG